MGIIYNEKAKTFTLHTQNTTYQMQIDAYGFLLHLYYGRKTDGVMDYLLTYADRGFSGNPQDMTEHIPLMCCRRNFHAA
jgi:alpha-galactosidase